MNLNLLGHTGLSVSPITIGAWQLGGPLFFDGKPDGHPDPGKDNVIRMIHELGDLGVNAIDTAEQYSAGKSERRVGEALKGRRDQWVVSTKFGYRVGEGNVRIDDSSPETIMPSVEGSLRRLKTDYIDVYLYHCAPEAAALDEGRAVLEKAKKQGKIRSYGISTNDLELLEKMVVAKTVEIVQFATSLLDEQAELWKLAQENNLGTQLRGVMAQGRLSGKYFKQAPEFRSDDNRSNWCADEDYSRFAVLAECLPEGMTMAQAAIRWILDHPGAHTICMGAKNIADYRSAIAASEMPSLEEAVRSRMEQAAESL
ncbi:aldo/keto reductase [Pontiella sulfatireligans]|uniref:General stress protein 69 n=1 Tax=Pontiella sulfatireligans TaxID=2750658 RepID=A0A6C2UPQ7_9BACT|nr:aldo/keto reductase [Pontiella sulfatireligans]VGO22049.1 General stress protein 69 [Pontiella sulfatireligans]